MAPDPAASPDPVMRHVAHRRDVLRREAVGIDAMLAAYSRSGGVSVSPRTPVSAIEHYSMLEESECGCATCAEWDMRRAEFVRATRLVPRGHKWSTCSCHVCRFVGRIQLNFLAASNRRDLLIETSYHAKHHSPFGEQVMAWLEQELRSPEYTVNWCAQEMSRYPLDRWLRRCEAALGPVVSGTVFRLGMHVEDMQVHFASSLTAMGELAA